MPDFDEKISELQTRLEKMVAYQEYFYREINLIRQEISSLKTFSPQETAAFKTENYRPPPTKKNAETISEKENQAVPPIDSAAAEQFGGRRRDETSPPVSQQFSSFTDAASPPASERPESRFSFDAQRNLEEFVGRNLISLIGIAITVLGVGIGTKYAIDRDLISPLGRIVLGYSFAFGLFAVAVRLKEKYLNFSAVLLSGAMAMMYFITYFAYGFYDLIAQSSAFAVMLIFTIFTVAAAVRYDRQVIAHVGLVGAYAVPFLLGNNSGRISVLFGYISIINLGILAVSIKKYWKFLFYSSFVITWLIYAAWYFDRYRTDEHFALSFAFLTVFFLTFYLTFIAYKLFAREQFGYENVGLLLINSFIFYGFGYAMIDARADGKRFLGLFTVANALVHFVVRLYVYRYTLADRSVINFFNALVLTFFTIAAPVQLDGNWVTLLWTAEAAILFYIGRAKSFSLYEIFAYPLMILAIVSLIDDWQTLHHFQNEPAFIPFFNQDFMTAVLFAAAFGFIYFINGSARYKTPAAVNADVLKIVDYAVPTVALLAFYNAFRIEISGYWSYQVFKITSENVSYAPLTGDLISFNVIWQINYSLFFLAVLSFVNIKKIKSDVLGFVNLGLNALVLLLFLTVGLYALGELRESYLQETAGAGVFHIVVRYVSYAFVAALIFAVYRYLKMGFWRAKFPEFNFEAAFDFVFYGALLWIASSELINLADIFGFGDADKLGLSILWGVCSLLLVVLGISRRKKYLRVGAIVLFAVTLSKVFFYDIAALDAVSKTVVFVSLGVLLLVISFLYNKYKHTIFQDSEANFDERL